MLFEEILIQCLANRRLSLNGPSFPFLCQTVFQFLDYSLSMQKKKLLGTLVSSRAFGAWGRSIPAREGHA